MSLTLEKCIHEIRYIIRTLKSIIQSTEKHTSSTYILIRMNKLYREMLMSTNKEILETFGDYLSRARAHLISDFNGKTIISVLESGLFNFEQQLLGQQMTKIRLTNDVERDTHESLGTLTHLPLDIQHLISDKLSNYETKTPKKKLDFEYDMSSDAF